MIMEILSTHNPKLRIKSKPLIKIDKRVQKIVADLKETLEVQTDPEGIGLAAPQVGKNIQVFVMKSKDKIKTIINPKIVNISKIKVTAKNVKGRAIMEGCLSLPNFYGPIERAQDIKLKYLDEEGNKRTEVFDGLESQIIQHEIDHLNGILFIDRLLEQKKPLFEYKNGEWEKVELI